MVETWFICTMWPYHVRLIPGGRHQVHLCRTYKGEPDYTLTCKAWHFDTANQRLALFDVWERAGHVANTMTFEQMSRVVPRVIEL